MKKTIAFFMTLTLGVSPLLAQTDGQYTKNFDSAKLKARVIKLSSDEFAGRSPGSKEGKASAQWIADELKAAGVKPGNGKSYFQDVKLSQLKIDQTGSTLSASANGKTESYKFGAEFVAFTGVQKPEVAIDAELIFAGYGISSELYKWNDYKGSADDYKGKVLMILVNDPPHTAAEPDLFQGKGLTYNGRWMYKYEEAARRGAAGVLLVHTDDSAGYGWNVVETSNGGTRFEIARTPNEKTPVLDMKAWVQNPVATKIMAMGGHDLAALKEKAKSRDFQSVKTGVRIKATMKAAATVDTSPNVVGMIPGSDPKLKNEYVIFTSHWDHLGVGKANDKGDTIYNGALDNASGVSAILGIADVIMKLPKGQRPKRSIYFLFPTAEEQGLLGTEYFVHNPLIPLNKIAANVNQDGVNLFGKALDFGALGEERSTLGVQVGDVATERGLSVAPDLRPEQGSFFRSDHFPFAKMGVPALSMRNGSKYVGKDADYINKMFNEFNTKHYHQPSDEFADWWDFDGIVQGTEIALAIAMKIANAPAMPRYKSTDEFYEADKRRMGGK